MAIREGKWKCGYCGQANLGRDLACSSCGQTRGKDVKFYLEDEAPEVTDQSLVDTATSGADWTCSFCATNNPARNAACRQCGAERGDSASLKERVILDAGKFAAGNSAARSGEAGASGTSGPIGTPGTPGTPGKPAKKPNLALIITLCAVAAVGIGFLVHFLFFSTTEKIGILESGSWKREIPVERNQWVMHTDWQDHVPAGARVLDVWSEKYGTEKIQTGTRRVKTGTRDKGNGFFEDVYSDQPVYTERDVYKNKVRYEALEWVTVRRPVAEGVLGDAPFWPATSLDFLEREGPRSESASLSFRVAAKNLRFTLKPDEMGQYRAGGKYRLWVTPLGAVRKVAPE